MSRKTERRKQQRLRARESRREGREAARRPLVFPVCVFHRIQRALAKLKFVSIVTYTRHRVYCTYNAR